MMARYERDGMYGGFSVQSTEKGWLVETWSREQGALSHGRWLVYYSFRFPHEIDLESSAGIAIPENTGDMIETVARFADQFPHEKVRCLRRPSRVE